MTVFLLLLIILVFYGVKIAPKGKFNEDYMSIEKTKPIKGIFTVLVFFSHINQYLILESLIDKPLYWFSLFLGQLVVTLFLFYSGYGIMESIKRKGFKYADDVFKKKLPSLLIRFNVVVLMYFVLQHFVFKVEFDSFVFWTSWIGYSGFGNSNWYMFVTFVLYIFVYVSFSVFKNREDETHYNAALVLTFLTILLIVTLKLAGKEHWWYDTAILFPLGIWYSIFKDRIEEIVMRNEKTYRMVLLLLFISYIAVAVFRLNMDALSFMIWGIIFTFLVVTVTMKLSIGNRVLNFCGDHVFSIYILQRLPMIVLANLGLPKSNKYAFFILSALITVILAYIFDKVFELIENKAKKQ